MQESAAKEGAKELAHKNLNKKAEKHDQKALKAEEYTLIKEEKKEAKKVAFTKARKPTATLKKLAHAEKQEKQEEEDTQKKYVISLQKEKEAQAKKVMATQRQKEVQAEKEQAELTAELKVKTEKKKIEMEKAAHNERQRKKVAVIIRAGKALAIQERKNTPNVSFSSGTSDLYTLSGLFHPLLALAALFLEITSSLHGS